MNTRVYLFLVLGYAFIIGAMHKEGTIFTQGFATHYTKNSFGDIFPDWQKIPHANFTEQLSLFVTFVKHQASGTPIIIDVPHEKAAVLDAIKKSGFVYRYGNNDKTQWLVENNSTIPTHPYTALIGTQLILLDDNGRFLAIKEKSRPKVLSFSGGMSKPQELPLQTLIREVKEELGIDIDPKSPKLIALLEQLNRNKEGGTGIGYHFLARIRDQMISKIKIDQKEVLKEFWLFPQDIAQNEKMEITAKDEKFVFDQFEKDLMQHVIDITKGCSSSKNITYLDYRQSRDRNPTKEIDPTDIMHVHFIAQKFKE